MKNHANKYIDLHAHLDGSITVDIAKKLAGMQKIKLPAGSDEKLIDMLSVPETCQNLNDFLRCFELPGSLLQTKEAISESVYLVLETMKKDGVVYAELRFAPQLHKRSGLTQEEVILAAAGGLKRARGELDMPANLILCCMRGKGNEDENNETIELAHKYLVKDGGVVAVDLAGAEALFPTKDYVALFAKAEKYGIPITIHAGEADGADSVKAAIEMGAVRIGHGVRIDGNEEIMRLVKDKGIYLEMCPTSNRQTKAVEDMKKYPFMKFFERGIKVTINTDDMAIERTSLSKEFRYMEEEFGLTPQQEQTILVNSIDAAFTTDEIKEMLKRDIK